MVKKHNVTATGEQSFMNIHPLYIYNWWVGPNKDFLIGPKVLQSDTAYHKVFQKGITVDSYVQVVYLLHYIPNRH